MRSARARGRAGFFFKLVLALVARGWFFLLVKWLALRAGQRQGGVFRLPPPKKNTLLPCSNLFRHLVSFSVLSGIIPHIKTFSRLISRRFSLSSKAPDANCLYSCLVVQKPKEKTEKTYIFFFGVTIFTTRIKTTKKNKNGPNKNPGETGVSICSKRYRKLFGSRQALNRSKRGKSQQYGGSADQNIYDTAQNAH